MYERENENKFNSIHGRPGCVSRRQDYTKCMREKMRISSILFMDDLGVFSRRQDYTKCMREKLRISSILFMDDLSVFLDDKTIPNV